MLSSELQSFLLDYGVIVIGMIIGFVYISCGLFTKPNENNYNDSIDNNDSFTKKNIVMKELSELKRDLSPKDIILMDMMTSNASSDLCWVISDLSLPDNPLVYASTGFLLFTGYREDEIIGKLVNHFVLVIVLYEN